MTHFHWEGNRRDLDGRDDCRKSASRSGALLCRSLLLRPALPLRRSDLGPCLGTEGTLSAASIGAAIYTLASQERTGLLEAGDLGIDFGNQLGCVHVGQCNPDSLGNLLHRKQDASACRTKSPPKDGGGGK